MLFPLLDEGREAWYGYYINIEGDIMIELELDRAGVLSILPNRDPFGH